MAQPTVDYIWKDGEIIAWDDAKVHVLTHGLHYGSGVFEGIRCYATSEGPQVFRLREHMERLERSARMMYMEIGYTVDEMMQAVIDIIKVNKVDSCYIRPLVYRGYGSMGVNPLQAPVDFFIAIWPWDTYLGEEALTQGVKVGISSWRKHSPNSLPPAIKATGNYTNSSFAKIEALHHGYNEAILLNEAGKVCEGTGENLFIVKNDVLYTPPVSDGILEGITRDSVMKIARDMGYEVVERSMVRSELYTADEFFMTGSAAELVPVNSVDEIKIGSGVAGPITMKLQKAYFAAAKGESVNYKGWLTGVE
ncbi:MAG: branched-chain amino acid transaminase [Coriobacteriia bacterium]|nr:branched-chain amino acid transaminase [Coriobacteriia bacterium]